MTHVKWTPKRHYLTNVDRMLDEFFNDGWNSSVQKKSTNWHPSVDINETDDVYTITADLPGVKKKDVKVTLKDGVLEINGERTLKSKEDDSTYHRRERSQGSFSRSFHLPETVLEDKISAGFKDGILSVEVPKAEEVKPKSHEIKIS